MSIFGLKHRRSDPDRSGISASRALSKFLSFLLIVFGGFALAVVILTFYLEFSAQHEHDIEHKMLSIGGRIEAYLDDRITTLQEYARFPLIVIAARGPEIYEESLDEFMRGLGMLGTRRQLVLLDRTGHEIHRTGETPDHDYGGESWLKPLLEGRTDSHCTVSHSGPDTFWQIAVPVMDGKTVSGALVAEIPTRDMVSKLRFPDLFEQDQIEFYKGKELIASFGPPIEAEPSTYLLKNRKIRIEYRLNKNLLQGMNHRLLFGIAVILLIVALLTIHFSIRLGSRSFVRPLERLRLMTANLTHGHRLLPEPVQSNIAEIRLLIRDFNHMAATIRERESQLQAAQNTLEARVEARTRDLNESHRRIDLILSTVQCGIMVIDVKKNRIVEVNEAFVSMTGTPRSELIGSSCMKTCACPDLESCKCRAMTHLPENEESTLQTAAGETLAVLKSAVPIALEGSEHLLVSFIDITERKLIEQKLEEARQSEIRLAAHIQDKLLLGQPPRRTGNISIGSLILPSQNVSGDFLDYHEWNDAAQGFDLLIGDVMGKGVNAALLGAGVKTAWQESLVRCLEEGWWAGVPPTQVIVQKLHSQIVPELMAFESFITCCYARFNIAEQLLEYVHCGHTQIIHWKQAEQRCVLLDGISPPLGMLREEEYSATFIPFEPGDCFVFYSDGLTEAEHPSGEMFGVDRLCGVVSRSNMLTPDDIRESIHRNVVGFTQTEDHTDDLTCIVLKVMPVNADAPEQTASQSPVKKVGLQDLIDVPGARPREERTVSTVSRDPHKRPHSA